MTLRERITQTLTGNTTGMTVRQLADTITDYPLPSIRRTVREMEQDDKVEAHLPTDSGRLHFSLCS